MGAQPNHIKKTDDAFDISTFFTPKITQLSESLNEIVSTADQQLISALPIAKNALQKKESYLTDYKYYDNYNNPPTMNSAKKEYFKNYNSQSYESHSLKLPKELLFPKNQPSHKERFSILQQWKGVVLSLKSDSDGDDIAIVELVDAKNEKYGEREIAELFLTEIPAGDLPYIKPGAVIYWTIGYIDGPGRPRETTSKIRLRRLGAISKHEISEAAKLASKWKSKLGGHKS